MKKHLFLFAIVILLFSSCKKDDDEDNNPSAITKENLSGTYVFVSATGKISGLPERDISNDTRLIPICKKDDILTLKPDLTFLSTDAGVTCPTDGNIFGVWSLPNDSTIVLNTEVFTIKQFDRTNLKLGYKTDTPLGQVDVTTNFRKQ